MKNRNDFTIIETPECTMDAMQAYLEGLDKKFVLTYIENTSEVSLCFYSQDKSIRALDLIDFISEGYGNKKGDEQYATTCISRVFIDVLMSNSDSKSIIECLEKKVNAYYEECDWIFAKEYAENNKEIIENMPLYKKKSIPWAFVKTIDIVPEGESFIFKSLENESGVEMVSSKDMYVMIGCRGEVYNITREKFDVTYNATEEKFDIFSQMPDYIPEVQKADSGEFISIDDKAYLCYPKSDKKIYAKEIDRLTKIFSEHNKGEYFLGLTGDYMAVRKDDLTDIYIIQREIFAQTYELVK